MNFSSSGGWGAVMAAVRRFSQVPLCSGKSSGYRRVGAVQQGNDGVVDVEVNVEVRQEFRTTPRAVRAGLNNQRIALLGLCGIARDQGGAANMPTTLVDFSAQQRDHGRVSFPEVFDRDALYEWMSGSGIMATNNPEAMDVEWRACFDRGAKLWEAREEEQFVSGFLKGMRGAPALRETAAAIAEHLGPHTGFVQLRVEHDWQEHARRKMEGGRPGFVLTPGEIFGKIANTSETAQYRRWFAFCDLSALPWTTDEIKEEISSSYGIEVVFKSDLPEQFLLPESSLINASLDFEIALNGHTYVGLGLDTTQAHYLYSTPTNTVLRRKDKGRGRW